MIAGYAGEHVLADKGYDAQEFRRHILELGMMPVIPPRSNRKEPADYDRHLYRERHLVECFINKMKHYRRIFSRFEKLDTRYLGFPAFHRRSHLVTVKCQQNLVPYVMRCSVSYLNYPTWKGSAAPSMTLSSTTARCLSNSVRHKRITARCRKKLNRMLMEGRPTDAAGVGVLRLTSTNHVHLLHTPGCRYGIPAFSEYEPSLR